VAECPGCSPQKFQPVHSRLVKWQHSTGVSRFGLIKIQPCLGHGFSCRRFNILLFIPSRRTLRLQTITTIYRIFINSYLTNISITGYYIAFVAQTAALSVLKIIRRRKSRPTRLEYLYPIQRERRERVFFYNLYFSSHEANLL
jgi:hypothetical protein